MLDTVVPSFHGLTRGVAGSNIFAVFGAQEWRANATPTVDCILPLVWPRE